MFYFHILELNVNEWVPIEGCILGIWTNRPYVQGWKYQFRRIYRYLDFMNISDISKIYRWIFLHEY